jgi:hypothetical protein
VKKPKEKWHPATYQIKVPGHLDERRRKKMTKEKEFKMDLTFERSFLPTRSSNIKIVAYVDGEINEELFPGLCPFAGQE